MNQTAPAILRIVGSRFPITIILFLLSLIFALPTEGQATPTLGPTKTATPGTSPVSTAVPEAQGEDATPQPFEPLTQADLNVLTGNVQRPNGITWFNDMLYTACTGDQTVYEINSRTGQTRTYIFGINNAHTLHVELDNLERLTMWVPDFAENELNLVTRSGVRRIAGDLEGPWGITMVSEELFLVSNLLGGNVASVTRDGEVEVLLEDLAAPTGLVHDEEWLYVANNGSTRRAIEVYPLSDVLAGQGDATAINLVSGIQNTTGLQLGPDGRLYFAYALGTRGVVGRVDPELCLANGGCTNDQVEIVVYTELEAPLAGLAITPDMRLFVHTMFAPDIYWAQLD